MPLSKAAKKFSIWFSTWLKEKRAEKRYFKQAVLLLADTDGFTHKFFAKKNLSKFISYNSIKS